MHRILAILNDCNIVRDTALYALFHLYIRQSAELFEFDQLNYYYWIKKKKYNDRRGGERAQ